MRPVEFSELAQLAGGYLEARAIQTAVSLGIFDTLKDGGLEAARVADALGTDRRATELLLNALTAMGLLDKKGRSFSVTPVSSTYLVKTSPKYFGGMIMFDASLWDAWGALERAVRTGRPVRPPDMYQSDPAATERFIGAMHSLVQARGDTTILAEAVDFSTVTELVDIGSGPGTYPIELCRRFPAMQATIFDLAGTIKITERFVRESGLTDRIKLMTGDYRRDAIPGSYQLALLSNIIHAESEKENERLMARVFACLASGGRVVIKDHILDDSLSHPPVAATFSLLMLLTTEGGRCYSLSEVRAWLKKAGFKRIAQIPLPRPLTSSLVVAEKE